MTKPLHSKTDAGLASMVINADKRIASARDSARRAIIAAGGALLELKFRYPSTQDYGAKVSALIHANCEKYKAKHGTDPSEMRYLGDVHQWSAARWLAQHPDVFDHVTTKAIAPREIKEAWRNLVRKVTSLQPHLRPIEIKDRTGGPVEEIAGIVENYRRRDSSDGKRKPKTVPLEPRPPTQAEIAREAIGIIAHQVGLHGDDPIDDIDDLRDAIVGAVELAIDEFKTERALLEAAAKGRELRNTKRPQPAIAGIAHRMERTP